MATPLSGFGTVSYNSYDMSGPTTRTVEFMLRPVYDGAGRTITYVVYRIGVEFIVNADGSRTDATMNTIKRALMVPGGALQYSDRGAGGSIAAAGDPGRFAINVTTPKDVVWGPKPVSLSWKQLGDGRSCKVTWVVEVAIPECANARTTGVLMEFCYRIEDNIDYAGFHRLSYVGYFRIPQTRRTLNDRRLSDDADSYLNRANFLCPPGFRFDGRTHSLSEDKCRLDFTVNYSQLARPQQPGVISCEASHRVENTPKSFVQWNATIRARYELAQDVPRTLAYKLFFDLVRERRAFIFRNAVSTVTGGRQDTAVPLSFSFEESDIFGRAVSSFSLSFTFHTELAAILESSGLWRPVTTANDQLWRTSLEATALNQRGIGNLKFQRNADAIVDLCNAPNVSPFPMLPTPQPPRPPALAEELHELTPKPSPANSWLAYHCSIRIEIDDGNIEHKPIPHTPTLATAAEPNPPPAPISTIIPEVSSGRPPAPANLTNKGAAIVNYTGGTKLGETQYVRQPSIYVILEGHAARLIFPIDPPQLRLFAGSPVVPANREGIEFYKQWVGGNLLVPVICAKWRLRWRLENAPQGGVGVVPNPIPS